MKSYSQIKQDIWIADKIKKPGFFVDIGAHNGIDLSNTYALEQSGWNGICIEPHPELFRELINNRKCMTVNSAISNYNGTANFHQNQESALSSLNENGEISVRVNRLDSILSAYHAPKDIDYVSLDVEGEELNILIDFPFDKWNVKCWTVEHNFYRHGNMQILINLTLLLMGQNYLVKTHDWDLFAIKDDFNPDYHFNFQSKTS